jgi:hypothetical protein
MRLRGTLHELWRFECLEMAQMVVVVGKVVSLTRSVTFTSLLGSAPVSPLALMVDVMAKMVTVPSKLCRPAMLRQPPVAGLSEAGYRDAVRHADIQSILQNVLEHPGAVDQAPFLQAGSGQRLGVSHVAIDRGRHQRSVTLVANVKRVGVGEPDAEGKRSGCARSCVGESRQDGDGHRPQGRQRSRSATCLRCPPDRRC